MRESKTSKARTCSTCKKELVLTAAELKTHANQCVIVQEVKDALHLQ